MMTQPLSRSEKFSFEDFDICADIDAGTDALDELTVVTLPPLAILFAELPIVIYIWYKPLLVKLKRFGILGESYKQFAEMILTRPVRND